MNATKPAVKGRDFLSIQFPVPPALIAHKVGRCCPGEAASAGTCWIHQAWKINSLLQHFVANNFPVSR